MSVDNGENGENGNGDNGQEEERELRPARRTENLALPIPGDASPADNPTAIGDLADAIDALSRTGFIGWRVGDIKTTAIQTAPDGWLMCNGQAISRSVFAALFEAIGVVFGGGDGATTFNVPDLRNTFPMGAASAAALGLRGGAAAVMLAAAEMPHHGHGYGDPGHSHGVTDHLHGVPAGSSPMQLWTPSGNIHQGTFNFAVGGASAAADRALGTDHRGTGISFVAEGGNQPHNNMPPYVGVNFLIKT